MGPQKIPLKWRLRTKFDWNSLLTLQKPSPWLLGLISVLALVKTIAPTFDLEFKMPLRLGLTLSGSITLFVAYLLAQLLCPVIIKAIRSKKELKDAAGLPVLTSILQAEVDRSSLPDEDVKRTLVNLLASVSPPIAGAVSASRGELFNFMETITQTDPNLNLAIKHARELFLYYRTAWRWSIGILAIVGYGLIALSFSIAIYTIFS